MVIGEHGDVEEKDGKMGANALVALGLMALSMGVCLLQKPLTA